MPILLNEIAPKPRQSAASAAEPRRRRDPEATRRSILESAAALFIEQGPSATSLSQIAKQAKVTKSLIHHHFGSKEELWREVQVRYFQAYFDTQMKIIQGSASTAELLEESVIAYFHFLKNEPKAVRFMAWASLENEDEPCMTEEKQLFEVGIEKIREAQEAGEVRSDVEPFFIIKTLIALPMAWFQTKVQTLALIDSDVDSGDLDELYLRDMVKIFLEGVRPARSGDSHGTLV